MSVQRFFDLKRWSALLATDTDASFSRIADIVEEMSEHPEVLALPTKEALAQVVLALRSRKPPTDEPQLAEELGVFVRYASSLYTTMEAIEMMLAFPAEEPQAFEKGAMHTSLFAAWKLAAAILKPKP